MVITRSTWAAMSRGFSAVSGTCSGQFLRGVGVVGTDDELVTGPDQVLGHGLAHDPQAR